ncbi:MAG: hypothetical protein HY608_11435 [Planctomycetes bacterium]|nr:hypothetical protein [Planctomycetota bacterium]
MPFLVVCLGPVACPGDEAPVTEPSATSALEALLARAAAEDKKVVVLFRKADLKEDPMPDAFGAIRARLGDGALFLEIDASDTGASGAVTRCQVDRIGSSAILVLAPDGTVLHGFLTPPDASLVGCIVASKVLADFRRALSSGGLLFVVVGPPQSESFREAVCQVRAYTLQAREEAAILQVDSADPDEAFLLEQAGVERGADRTTVCLLRAGESRGKLTGEITVERIRAQMERCAPGGCGPEG